MTRTGDLRAGRLAAILCVAGVCAAGAAPAGPAHAADATPCTPFQQPPADARLVAAVAARARAPGARVLDSFRAGRWRMVYVDTRRSDETLFVFPGDPVRTGYRTWWAGAARLDEEADMRRWIKRHAPGLPDGLASCFGWYVTRGRTQ